MKGETMKVSCLVVVIFVSVTRTSAFMPEEDKLGISKWNEWSEKEKIIFLTGFRIGSGPIVKSVPATTDKELLISSDYADLSKQMDAFYRDRANKDVILRGAIEVILMELRLASPDSIQKKLELERTRRCWGG